MGVLDTLPGVVAGALGGLAKPMTLKKPGVSTSDGRGGFTTAAAANHAARGFVLEFSDFQRASSGGEILAQDRRALVLAATLPAGVAPVVGDTVTAEGRDWRVIRVSRDPAAASWELQVR